MNSVQKSNPYSQATVVSIPMTQTVGAPYGYTSMPILTYPQQIMAQPQQIWTSKPQSFNAPPMTTAQHVNGGLVCILPDNMARLAVDPNNGSGQLSSVQNPSSCVYGVYYSANGSTSGWGAIESSNMPQSYYVPSPMPVRIMDMQHQQQATPPLTPSFTNQTQPTQISYMPATVNTQGQQLPSQISYAAATSFQHAPRVQKNAVCRHFLAGRCNRRNCRFSHVLDGETSM